MVSVEIGGFGRDRQPVESWYRGLERFATGKTVESPAAYKGMFC